jgi:ClpP class serine protease
MTCAEIVYNALHNHKGPITAFVPCYSFFAKVIISMTANEIYLDKVAIMGHGDPQLITF